MGWWHQFGPGGLGRSRDGGDNDSARWRGIGSPGRRRWRRGAVEPLEDRRLMAIDWQSSPAVHNAILRAQDLTQYSDAQMAQTTSWVVGVSPGISLGQVSYQAPLHKIGFQNLISNAYIWEFAPELNARGVGEALGAIKGLDYFYPLVPTIPQLMAVPNDPYFGNQWHLQNTGANSQGGLVGADANVVPAWDITTGLGVVIGIVDGGTQYTHPDLSGRYLPAFSFDFLDGDADPAPGNADDNHGTSVAGVAAANGNNALGVTGASQQASLAAIRLIGGAVTDSQLAAALIFQNQDIDIYNNSWGYSGFSYQAPPLLLAAMQQSATTGRGGLGNVILFAAGNDGDAFAGQVDVSAAGIQSSIHSITVAAIDERGVKAVYSQEGAAVFVSGYTQGDFGRVATTTTDRTGNDGYNAAGTADGDPFADTDYTSGFNGTSSATPLVSGVVGLILAANPGLTFRDVQEIIVQTARQNDPSDPAWSVNGAGHHINHKYGFGAIDALPAVQLAQSWTPLNPQITLSTGTIGVNAGIPDNNNNGVSNSAFIPQDIKVERVEVVFDATHSDRGDLLVELVSPDGTSSILSPVRAQNTGANFNNWVFSSVRHWGETSQGTWTLRVSDRDGNGKTGTFASWQLNIYGSDPHPPVAVADVAAGFEEVPLDIAVLANDVDFDGRLVPASIQIVSQPASGTLSVNPVTGVVTYTGNKDFFGVDVFSYRVADNTHRLSNIVTVTVTLANVNDPPVAVNDVGKALAGPIIVSVLDNDFDVDNPLDPSSVQIVSGPFSGVATVNPVTGAITYTPPVGFAGGDILSYTITDAESAVSNVATVKFRVGLPISLSGHVYIDNNGNGIQDPGEQGLVGVLVTLSKTDGPFTFTEAVTTGTGGAYSFAEVDGTEVIYPTGAYTLTEVQPDVFLDGADTAGSHPPAFSVNDQFGGMLLVPGANSTGWTFAERGLKAEFLSTYLGAWLFMASNSGGSIASLAFESSGSQAALEALAGLPGLEVFQVSANPSGLALTVNGKKSTSELLVVAIPGTTTAVTAPAIQAFNGTAYLFDSWSDGAPSNRTVTAGAGAQTLTARYRPLEGSTTNYAYVLAAGSKLGVAAISAEQLSQLVGQLAQGGSRGAVGAALWSTPENFGRLVERMYQTYLHRAADASGRQALVSRLETGAKENDLAAEILAGVEYALNGHLSPAQFVDGLYRDVLGRNADAAGRATWVAAIERGASRLDVAKAFLNSEEHLGRVVEQYYRDILGRGSDAGGKAMYVGQLKSGSLTTASMAARMLASDEFFNRATGSQLSAGETAFARALYSDLAGRTPTANELASWSISVSLGTSRQEMISQLWDTADSLGRRVERLYQSILHRPADAVGRASNINLLLSGASEEDIARTLLTSTEYAQSHATNAAFVEGLYRDVLGRNSDAGGKAGWVRSLDAGRSRAEVAASFLSSDERYLKIIDGYYASYLGRAADAAGRSFYLGWLRQGLLTTATAAEAMLASDEYFARSGRRRV